MIEARHLFPVLDEKLIQLLRSLAHDDWNKPTVAGLWTVKDVAAHLLDGNLRMLSFSRDGQSSPPDSPLTSYQDLVIYLNRLNADWINASRRLSPKVITDLLESTGHAYSAFIQTLDPHDIALFSVAWAGEQTSANWFHVAREFTEKWHHQQQIRKATDRPGIMTSDLFYPFMHTLILGMPHAFRNVEAHPGTVVQIVVESDVGGTWHVVRNDVAWHLSDRPDNPFAAKVSLDPDAAWQLFTSSSKPADLLERAKVSGNELLARAALTLTAVMA